METSAATVPPSSIAPQGNPASSNVHLFTRLTQALVTILVVLAPFPFGSVQSQWVFAIEISVCLLIFLWAATQIASGEVSFVRAGLTKPLALLVSYLAITLFPIPRRLLDLISPRASELYQAAGRATSDLGAGGISGFRITLAPFDTEAELLKLVAYVLFFLLALNVLRYRGGFLATYWAMITGGTALAAFGIVQSLWSNGLIYWKYDSESGRPFGPFANHNHFAGYIELILGLALGMLAAEIGRFQKRHSPAGLSGSIAWIWHRDGTLPWMLSVACFILIAALTASLSRGGLVSFLITAFLFGTALLLRRPLDTPGPPTHKRQRWLVAIALTLIVSVVVVMMFSPRIGARWSSIVDESARYRTTVWREGLDALSEFPLTGSGLGSFRSIYPSYRKGASNSEASHAENEYLEWAIETGVLGVVLMTSVVLSFAFQMGSRLRTRRDPYFRSLAYGTLFSLTSLTFHNLLDFNTHIPSNALTLAAVAALCMIAANYHRGSFADRFVMEVAYLPIRSAKATAMLGCVLVAALLFGRQSWACYESSRLETQWTRDRSFIVQGDPDERNLAPLSEAARWAPRNDREAYLEATAFESAAAGKGLLQVYARQELLSHAQRAIARAIELRPPEARYWACLGRIEQGLSRNDRAEAAFRQAVALAKTDGWIQRDYGFFLLSAGDVRGAAARFLIARNFAPALDLRQMLEWISSRTPDPKIWQSIVRYQPQDLRIYADYLNSRGFTDLGKEISREADALERSRKLLNNQ